jgi:N-acyl-D-amino-acid deacylase
MNILLKNGLVYDGTRSGPVVADVRIRGSLIDKIAPDLSVIEGEELIDCKGQCISPGFIDAHSHNDFFVNLRHSDEAIMPFLQQGITTQIVGNCGFSAYGVEEGSPFNHYVGGGLFRGGKPTSLLQFVDDTKGNLLLNLIPLVGHGTTRITVNGRGATVLTSEQYERQERVLREALQQGAFGGSLGLMYVPGMFAPKEELIKFAKIIKEYDGILTVHPRANSRIALGYSLLGKPHIEQALDEVIEIMKATGVRVEYSHLIFVGKSSWRCVDKMIEKFELARNEGYEIGFDLYPFTYGASVITVVLPDWYLKLDEKNRKSSWTLFKLRTIITLTKKLLGIEFSDMIVSYVGEKYKHYEGLTVQQIADQEKKSGFDMYLKLIDLSQGQARIMLGRYYNDAIIRRLMENDISVFMTDAWYEWSGTQNGGTYQAFPLFLEKTKSYQLPLEHTIHKMTGKTAERFHIPNRGFIREGYAADITVFDYDKIAVNQAIPHSTPVGIEHVIINGELMISKNKYSGKHPGIVLQKNI